MDLSYAHKLLVATTQQRHGFLKIRGRQADHEVRLMVEAGLVDATFGDGKDGSFTAINRVTKLGHAFLRAFKDSPLPRGSCPGRTAGMAGEWILDP